MDYVVELDPRHRVLRATFGPVLTDEILERAYLEVREMTSTMGPVRGVADFSSVTEFQVSPEMVRKLAQNSPALPEGSLRIVVAPTPVIFGMSRLFQITRDGMQGTLHVVQTLEEAYSVLGGEQFEFTERL